MQSSVEGKTQCKAQQESLLLSGRYTKISMQPFFETQEQGVTVITLQSKFSDNTMYVQPKRLTVNKPEGFILRKKTTPIPIDGTPHRDNLPKVPHHIMSRD